VLIGIYAALIGTTTDDL